jgi:hypothetical protein
MVTVRRERKLGHQQLVLSQPLQVALVGLVMPPLTPPQAAVRPLDFSDVALVLLVGSLEVALKLVG